MFYSNTCKNWATAQGLICHYDLFSQIVSLRKATSKRTFSVQYRALRVKPYVHFIVAGEGFVSVVKWREVKVLVKCVCSIPCSYVCNSLCQIVITADSSTLGSLLGLNTRFLFLMCVVYVLYCFCNFVLYIVLSVVCYFVWYVLVCVFCVIVVPLPSGTNPFAVNNNNNSNNNSKFARKALLCNIECFHIVDSDV